MYYTQLPDDLPEPATEIYKEMNTWALIDVLEKLEKNGLNIQLPIIDGLTF